MSEAFRLDEVTGLKPFIAEHFLGMCYGYVLVLAFVPVGGFAITHAVVAKIDGELRTVPVQELRLADIGASVRRDWFEQATSPVPDFGQQGET